LINKYRSYLRIGTLERGGHKKRVQESECGGNITYSYDNGKMRPAETIPGMGGGELKEIDGRNEFNYDTL
jgi:hypothetical protein